MRFCAAIIDDGMSSLQQCLSDISRYTIFEAYHIRDGATRVFIQLRILNHESEGAVIFAVVNEKLLEEIRCGFSTFFFPLNRGFGPVTTDRTCFRCIYPRYSDVCDAINTVGTTFNTGLEG